MRSLPLALVVVLGILVALGVRGLKRPPHLERRPTRPADPARDARLTVVRRMAWKVIGVALIVAGWVWMTAAAHDLLYPLLALMACVWWLRVEGLVREVAGARREE